MALLLWTVTLVIMRKLGFGSTPRWESHQLTALTQRSNSLSTIFFLNLCLPLENFQSLQLIIFNNIVQFKKFLLFVNRIVPALFVTITKVPFLLNLGIRVEELSCEMCPLILNNDHVITQLSSREAGNSRRKQRRGEREALQPLLRWDRRTLKQWRPPHQKYATTSDQCEKLESY